MLPTFLLGKKEEERTDEQNLLMRNGRFASRKPARALEPVIHLSHCGISTLSRPASSGCMLAARCGVRRSRRLPAPAVGRSIASPLTRIDGD